MTPIIDAPPPFTPGAEVRAFLAEYSTPKVMRLPEVREAVQQVRAELARRQSLTRAQRKAGS
jgi:hypothetical protein